MGAGHSFSCTHHSSQLGYNPKLALKKAASAFRTLQNSTLK